MHEQAVEVVDHLLMLLSKYPRELRSSTQPSRMYDRRAVDPNYQYRPDDPLIRENLLEHVGALPVVATALFPYVQDPQVNLGKALTMLAIHDIGELLVGDVNTYIRRPEMAIDEEKAALGLLHQTYHQMYRDMESHAQISTARFAQAVDKLTPDVFELLIPVEYSVARLKHFAGLEPTQILPAVIKRTRPHVLWNPFLMALHVEVCERLAVRMATREQKPG
jgi:hypothetical protein